MLHNKFTLGNRKAVITGGSKNIGLAIAETFSRAGLKVAIVSSNVEHIKTTQTYMNGKGCSPSVRTCDVSDVSSLEPTCDENAREGLQKSHPDVVVGC